MHITSRVAPLFLALAAAACTGKAKGDQIEKKITEWGKEQGVGFKGVKCPASIDVKVGGTFTCTATTPLDETLTINGKVTSKSGSNFEYSIELVEKTYFAEKVAAMLDEQLTQQFSVKPKAVDCGAAGLHKIPANLTVVCTATDPQGIATKIDVTFKADGAVERWAAQGGPPPAAPEAPAQPDPGAAGDDPAAPADPGAAPQ